MEKGKFALYDEKFYVKENFDIEQCKKAAEEGNPEAQTSLAECYLGEYFELEKNENDEFNKELKSIKEELYSEFKEKEKEAIENLEAKRKSEIEALFKERNSSKDSEIEKYEEIIRKESLQTKK